MAERKKRKKEHYFCVLSNETETGVDALGFWDAIRKKQDRIVIAVGTNNRLWKKVKKIPESAEPFHSIKYKLIKGKTRVRVYFGDPFKVQDGIFTGYSSLSGLSFMVIRVGEEKIYVHTVIAEVILLED